eukprot:GHVU01221356.1.p1 GENE.GHVU01221356.1~~GHVU01221356.1.p1  ORF type:complete len:158 (+),score=13.33 GHVU01221356.1:664-1137(+)
MMIVSDDAVSLSLSLSLSLSFDHWFMLAAASIELSLSPSSLVIDPATLKFPTKKSRFAFLPAVCLSVCLSCLCRLHSRKTVPSIDTDTTTRVRTTPPVPYRRRLTRLWCRLTDWLAGTKTQSLYTRTHTHTHTHTHAHTHTQDDDTRRITTRHPYGA